MLAADAAMPGSLLTLDDKLEGPIAIDLDSAFGAGNMTMRVSGEHRPSGKEGSVHVDTCKWSDTFDKGGAERFLVASAGDYTFPAFGEELPRLLHFRKQAL